MQPPITFEEWLDCLELNLPENSYEKGLVLQAYKMGYNV